ncbi:MAG: carboxylate-amine ligase [Gammaproteobacteria bacterium]|nr:carboxylate-amine ligase [Gammaproteobacteria bacterium]MDH5226793.1 carboxylate-amine ligase [Gammaproteobacteria bacterium]
MADRSPPLTIGIEEEYLLVDIESRAVANDPPPALFTALHERTEGRAFPEFLRSQIEVATPVCETIAEARQSLVELRRAVIEESARFGLAPIAAGTHPFSLSSKQKRTDKERYVALLEEMQGVARRMMICGLHVHVGIDDDELRIDLMNQARYFLPHLLALSCSSPFWEGERTGLMAFRLMVFNGIPRTGLPETFASWSEYRRHMNTLVETGVIADTSRIWWDLRPSSQYPTLETRVMDSCTTLDDAVALAALNLCLMRKLWRLRCDNQHWRSYPALLIDENRWRAMRYSGDAGLLDLGRQRVVPFGELVEEIIELLREDAIALGCLAEIEGLREILRRGTSAHRQLHVFEAAVQAGASEDEAFTRVVDWLIEETAR